MADSLILSIETSTPVCSVALHQNGQLLGISEIISQKNHSSLITVLIENLVKNCGFTLADLSAVAVAKGPGSYTGLRIGVSTAKGLCFALKKPLVAVNTLEAMTLQVIDYQPEYGYLFCPMLDARRMEVFCAVFESDLETVLPTSAVIIDENAFAEQLADYQVLFFGNGAEKCRQYAGDWQRATFLNNIHPSAKQVGILATRRFEKQQFEDLAYFEPFYLKEFVGNLSNFKALGSKK
ncbi:MAG: tRNA (adenosine(37)-N6)-threonylcarbamoyltransferase complex dimerization subunit type 1 TsaB [Verrucomicrobia bacterium]|nr:tRNA (adenosine(37)-N6)-threonylcarbamoyltransferase complex dimerization subunit type 1 TsaB [Cytophagales bacterium]